METNEQTIDSKGTTQAEAREMLNDLCEKRFAGNAGKLALALGRDEDEITDFLAGIGDIDEDLVMKARGIRQERDE
ncbi:MAG: hypothetical protein ACR2GD_00070 [Pyrinomonadaceae bacterium]